MKKAFGILPFCLLVFLNSCSVFEKPDVYYASEFSSDLSSNASKKPTMRPYVINGKTYYPAVVKVGEKFDGIASWYGPGFHGKKTSNGEIYDQNSLTAAHKTMPMNTILRVKNLQNSREVIVRINDRGPFVGNRIIDLSKEAAKKIDMLEAGTAKVRIEVLGFAEKNQGEFVKNNAEQSFEGGNFMVQIGAFKRSEGAREFAKRYENFKGYKTIIKNIEKDDLNRVFLSGFKSEDEARDFAVNSEFLGAFIVRE